MRIGQIMKIHKLIKLKHNPPSINGKNIVEWKPRFTDFMINLFIVR